MQKIALYGLGTETERLLPEFKKDYEVVGLLDGFRDSGTEFGCPIISLYDLPDLGVNKIIVVARPGSCKAIRKRIGAFCREHGIELFDNRGKDLLVKEEVSFDLSSIKGGTESELRQRIREADMVSFDLFDTLITRKVLSYSDVFEILEGRYFPGFAKKRLQVEKELTRGHSPRLEAIYENIPEVNAREAAEEEYELEKQLLLPRYKMREIFDEAVSLGKRVFITSDTYYSKSQIEDILRDKGYSGYEDVLASCEYDVIKPDGLFEKLKAFKRDESERILHIGDDEEADIKGAEAAEIEAFRIFSPDTFFDKLGCLGMEELIVTPSDKVKAGLFTSIVFNDPFIFETENGKISVHNSFDIGYLVCAPMITDFVFWMENEAKKSDIRQILLGARDGFLIEKLINILSTTTKHLYFLTSRMAAIRAGVKDEDDIAYVDSMKFFGTEEQRLAARFGLELHGDEMKDKNRWILEQAKLLRNNYAKYLEKADIEITKSAFFDFVAKGTTQMFMEKVLGTSLVGLYFLQLEPEFMSDKNLEIRPFYTEEEKETSAVFDNYYILETMLTAPHPAVQEFDDNGEPVFAEETRSERDIKCFERAQRGIETYFDEYIRILPETLRIENKKLDEAFLTLINHVEILDEDFLALTVEDPFVGRMTDIKDVIG